MACGFVPVTVSSDLLRIGGFGRIGTYLQALEKAMTVVGTTNVNDYVLAAFGQAEAAKEKAAAEKQNPLPLGEGRVRVPDALEDSSTIAWAGMLNTTIAAEKARGEVRYRADKNRKHPPRIDSHLETFDCLTCDKCLPVCPNAANFASATPLVAFEYQDLIIDPAGSVGVDGAKKFEITEKMQIACYSDFCNECGNCDTFCPEYGGPYIKKPTFYGTQKIVARRRPARGFLLTARKKSPASSAAFKARFALVAAAIEKYEFTDGIARTTLNARRRSAGGNRIRRATDRSPPHQFGHPHTPPPVRGVLTAATSTRLMQPIAGSGSF